MFTGLVQEMGELVAKEPSAGGIRVWIRTAALPVPAIGDSVAVDGCCLTVVAIEEKRLAFDAVPETLARTTLGGREPGDPVNLELPLRPTDRLGGHFVQGHVDALSRLVERSEGADGVVFTFEVPEALRGQVVEKGSIAIDGVSLTVASVENGRFSVALIPHTLAVTTLGGRRPGDAVNLEGDILAKYVASLVAR